MSMVENVVELSSECQLLSFSELYILHESQVPVRDSRTVKETPIGIAELTQSFQTE